ncbi:hypothetical protein AK812_SmicGene42354 [Symbiodinium microadriaticum]|uniref:Uncharacterized protein n=1 Tax=Symbiodinium microadriaticum TaxID=2951 RepID=A0A1Q9C3S8_SYMMI|nr:hypothetical protein AK812_SmicGene42354 [Symbiodinium microadriaticum]
MRTYSRFFAVGGLALFEVSTGFVVLLQQWRGAAGEVQVGFAAEPSMTMPARIWRFVSFGFGHFAGTASYFWQILSFMISATAQVLWRRGEDPGYFKCCGFVVKIPAGRDNTFMYAILLNALDVEMTLVLFVMYILTEIACVCEDGESALARDAGRQRAELLRMFFHSVEGNLDVRFWSAVKAQELLQEQSKAAIRKLLTKAEQARLQQAEDDEDFVPEEAAVQADIRANVEVVHENRKEVVVAESRSRAVDKSKPVATDKEEIQRLSKENEGLKQRAAAAEALQKRSQETLARQKDAMKF